MDPRVREHAETLVDWSARIEPGDDVVVHVGEGTHELGVAVAAALGERGANLLARYRSEELRRAYLRAHDGTFTADPGYEQALYERADSVLSLRGTRNTRATADVPEGRRQAYTSAQQGIREARLSTDWVSTVHPTRALAQQAGMSYPADREFVYRRSRPSASGLDPEGEGRTLITHPLQAKNTVATWVKDLNPKQLPAVARKCDISQNPRLWRGVVRKTESFVITKIFDFRTTTGVVERGGAADPHGHRAFGCEFQPTHFGKVEGN